MSTRHDPNCIFCKIVSGQIPAKKAYEDEELLAFHDINPWAPVHVLIIPKAHIATLYDAQADDDAVLGRMMGLAPRLMQELGPLHSAAPAFPLATAGIAPLRAAAEARGSSDFTPLWAGQNTGGCRVLPAAEITREFLQAWGTA